MVGQLVKLWVIKGHNSIHELVCPHLYTRRSVAALRADKGLRPPTGAHPAKRLRPHIRLRTRVRPPSLACAMRRTPLVRPASPPPPALPPPLLPPRLPHCRPTQPIIGCVGHSTMI